MSYTMCKKELEWLEWTAHVIVKKIDHRFNGRQLVVKAAKDERYPVDGFVPSERKIF